MYKIAVLGERESVMGFAALGLAVFPVESAEEAAEAFHRLTRQSDAYAIIYVTETYRYVPATTWERSGLGWTGRCRVWNVPREAQWVRLILDFDEEPITILLEREEGAP